MGAIYKNSHQYIKLPEPGSIFLEIGSERGEGSTAYFADLAAQYNVQFHTVDVDPNCKNKVNKENIHWHTALGSDWTKQYHLNPQSISLLYLDNFDYIWDIRRRGNDPALLWNEDIYQAIRGEDWPKDYVPFEQLPDWIQEEVRTQRGVSYDNMMLDMLITYKNFGMALSNNNCQIEHFKQLYDVFPYLTSECVVIFDDTYRVNDCWIGKNGPGVIFLQSQGFKIVERSATGVILTRGNE